MTADYRAYDAVWSYLEGTLLAVNGRCIKNMDQYLAVVSKTWPGN